MKTIVLVGLACLITGLVIGRWWQRKQIFKKIIPEDWQRFAVKGKNCLMMFKGHLLIRSFGKKIEKVEFTKRIA
jgi:hypothetical protein